MWNDQGPPSTSALTSASIRNNGLKYKKNIFLCTFKFYTCVHWNMPLSRLVSKTHNQHVSLEKNGLFIHYLYLHDNKCWCDHTGEGKCSSLCVGIQDAYQHSKISQLGPEENSLSHDRLVLSLWHVCPQSTSPAKQDYSASSITSFQQLCSQHFESFGIW